MRLIARALHSFTQSVLIACKPSVFIRLYRHVVILYYQVGSQLLPSCQHALCLRHAVVVQVLLHSGRLHVARLLLNGRLLHEVRLLQRVAHRLQRREQHLIARIDHVRHPVLHPEGVLVAEGDIVGTRRVVALRALRHRTVDGRIGHHVAVVVAKPEAAAHLSGQPRAHLAHKGPCRLLSRCGTLVEVLLAVHLIIKRCRTVRHAPDAGTHVGGVDGQVCSLIVVAHVGHDVLHAQFLFGDDPQRHVLRILVLAQRPGQISLHALHVVVVETPHAGIADTATAKVGERIGILKRELLVLAVEPPHFTRILDDILRVQHVLLVLQGEGAYAALVGMSADGVVGNSPGHPHHTLLRHLTVGSAALHLQNPRLLWVTDGKCLTLRVVAVSLCQRGHYLNGLTCRLGTLQGDIDQRAIVYESR